jgi:hypothetical protein
LIGFLLLILRIGSRLIGHRITGPHIFEPGVVVTQPFNFVVRCFQKFIRDQHHGYLQAKLKLRDIGTFFVQQEGGYFDRHLDMQGSSAFFHRLFLQNPQNVKGAGVHVADHAGAITAGAGDVGAFIQGRPQPLA